MMDKNQETGHGLETSSECINIDIDGIENIVLNLDSSSDNNSSYSYSTSQISTFEEIYYDSPKPPKSLLRWYHYLSDGYKDNGRFWGSKSGCNESDIKASWKDIKKAKACMLAKAQASEASFKAKVETCEGESDERVSCAFGGYERKCNGHDGWQTTVLALDNMFDVSMKRSESVDSGKKIVRDGGSTPTQQQRINTMEKILSEMKHEPSQQRGPFDGC
nr:hypothetical protein [Tanacetum cinerariifolium]